jgi:hypothetical protein
MLHRCLTQPKVLKAWTQMAHTQISPPNTRIIHIGLGSHKEWLGRAQEAVERVGKWLGSSNPRERGWNAFYRNLKKKLAIGAVRADWSDQSIIPVRPVWRLQTSSGHSLKKSLSDNTVELGPRHVQRRARQVQRRAGQVRWSSNYNSHKFHRTCLVQDRTCPKNLSRNWPSRRTCPILGT